MYYLEAYFDGGWHLIGQYADRKQAETIAADERRRGRRVRITTEE